MSVDTWGIVGEMQIVDDVRAETEDILARDCTDARLAWEARGADSVVLYCDRMLIWRGENAVWCTFNIPNRSKC